MKLSKTLQLTLMVIAIAITAGCSSQKTWSYHPNSYAVTASTGKKIAVLPFDDERKNENSNMYGISMIPLVPYGWQDLNTPEGIQMHTTSGMWVNFKPTEDFPKAVAEDLRNTGLFSDAFFSYQRLGSDYAVEGKILSTKYRGYTITYGLSCYGAYLWMIGFPCASTVNELSVEMTLVDSASNEPLFSKTYTADPKKGVSWIYDIHNDFNYAEMLAEVNKQFCQDIEPIVLKSAQESTGQSATATPATKMP